MVELLAKIKKVPLADTVKKVLCGRFFPFVTAAVVLADYYLGWDIVNFYYVSIVGILMLVMLKDLTPLLSIFLFMNVMISVGNSPSPISGGADFITDTAVIVQIGVLVSLFSVAAIARLYVTADRGRFKPTPVFWGLCVLAAAFIFNGAMSAEYTPNNLLYGTLMAFFFLVIFALMKDNVEVNEKTLTNIAFAFMALALVLAVELTVKYAADEVVVDGVIDRSKLFFGWGTYNYFGMLAVLCLPSAFYLAGKQRHGYLFFVAAIVITVLAVMSMSRQAILGSVVLFPVLLVLLIVKGKYKIANGAIALAAVIIVIALALGFKEDTELLFGDLLKSLETGSGRLGLWKKAWIAFRSAPMFGTGFYVELAEDYGAAGMALIPDMYHNTIFQLLASCGFVGLAAYLFHRVQTVISFFKNPTLGRAYIAITIVSMLLLNLLDNHLFYILPTIVYSTLLAIFVKAEKK